MIACIDSGNSRVKWGIHDGQRWLETGAAAHGDLSELAKLAERFSPNNAILANVAGEAAAEAIRCALAPWQDILEIARASPAACGVQNRYENPTQLGVDRWCALIGARSLIQAPCLVIMAGTATTIDTLDGDGNFLGGLILPGVELMRRSLARDTAALPLADGQHFNHPRNTDDAITSGCLEAQCGAIERAFRRIPKADSARCFLSGGSASLLSPLLSIPHLAVDNLVLEGLRCLARKR